MPTLASELRATLPAPGLVPLIFVVAALITFSGLVTFTGWGVGSSGSEITSSDEGELPSSLYIQNNIIIN